MKGKGCYKIKVNTSDVLDREFWLDDERFECSRGEFYFIGDASEVSQLIGKLIEHEIFRECVYVGVGYFDDIKRDYKR